MIFGGSRAVSKRDFQYPLLTHTYTHTHRLGRRHYCPLQNCICVHLHTLSLTYPHAHTHTNTHTHARACTQAHTHTHTHTHTLLHTRTHTGWVDDVVVGVKSYGKRKNGQRRACSCRCGSPSQLSTAWPAHNAWSLRRRSTLL